MAYQKRSEAIQAFLIKNTWPDLAELYSKEMEVQVNVAQDGGKLVHRQYLGRDIREYTDDIQTWKMFRIPLKAMLEPEDNDIDLRFDLQAHVDGIGMTGWNWIQRKSVWIAYDFDAIVGHSEKHTKKLTNAELNEIQQKIIDIPWITLRKSTSGSGLHVYVFLDIPDKINNHNEHMAIGRTVLSQLSAMAGFDFEAKVDVNAGNMWVWHRKMMLPGGGRNPNGLALIKQGVKLTSIPKDWRDYVDVVKGKRRRTVPSFLQGSDVELDLFEELSNQRGKVPLDKDHTQLLNWIQENNPGSSYWREDHWMLVTNAHTLKRAHGSLKLKGEYETLSTLEGEVEQNCFSGETEFITKAGVRTLRECVGQDVQVLSWDGSNYVWMPANIQSFGLQETVPMLFGDGTIIRSTETHRWPFIKNNQMVINNHSWIYTKDLRCGKTQIPIASQELPEINWTGYAHGFVFGDGWMKEQKTTEVELYGTKEEMLPLLAKYGSIGHNGFIPAIRALPRNWKFLPHNPTREYALGFILGLVSADGSVDKRVQIFNKDKEICESIRKLAVFAGLKAYPVRKHKNSEGSYRPGEYHYAITILTYNLTPDHFIRSCQKVAFDKREKQTCMTVSAVVRWDTRTEEVFCAVVPETHNFVLANHVVTLNCYAFPLLNGAWTVRRYTRGCAESKTWNQDGQGWTTCVLNRLPDFKLACRLHGGIEKPNGSFVFNEASLAIKAAKMLGGNLSIPEKMAGRTTVLGRHKDQRLIIHLEKETKDTYEGLEGFDGTGKTWTKIFDGKIDQTQPTVDTLGMDKMVRHVVNEGGRDEGWVIRSDSAWRDEPLEHVKIMLRGNFQYKPTEVDQILGTAISQPYKLVNMPFDVEYPPGRLWNRKAARLRFEPSQDLDNLQFSTWVKVMDHLGKNLDPYLKEHPWAKAYNITSGAEYLVLWIAAMFQKPYHRAPYLFFFSEPWTNTGKSTFHEAITLLMGGDPNFKDAPPYGYMKVNEALKANANFNAELQHSLLCVVEELDLNPKRSDAKISANRIKELVTGNYIGIHEKRQTPCMVRNTTRWVQCANEKSACPIFKDDSRITVFRVNQIDDIDMVPKEQLMEMLLKEGPDFLAHILHLEIPPSNERLIIPAIETTDKHTIQSANNSIVEQFINENAYPVDGEMIPWGEFFDTFQKWMEPIDLEKWSKHYTGQHLPDQHPKGRRRVDRQYCIGNISWVRPEPDAPVKQRLVLKDECLIPIGGDK